MPSPTITRYAGNPVIPLLAASWYAEQIYDFCPVINPNNTSQLLVYCSGMAAPVQTGIQSIGLFTANVSNPYSLTEHGGAGNGQLITANASGWENAGKGLRASCVVNVSGTLYLYYTAQDASGGNQIGLATSTDGTTWTKYASNPVLVSTADETRVLNPSVYYDGTTFYMVYNYYTATTTLAAFRAATSTDGKTWTRLPHIAGALWDVYSNSGSFNEWQSIFKYKNAFWLGADAGNPNSSSGFWTGRLLISAFPTGPWTALSYDPTLSGAGPIGTGSSTTPWDKDHVSCTGFFLPPSADPMFYYAGANNNVPTVNNTNYGLDQWPGGAATFVGGIPFDIGNIVAPSLCNRKCQLTFNGSLVLESNSYAVCFGGSGNTENGLVARLPNELFTLAQSNGGDICFSSDAGGQNQLPCEIVSFTPGSSQCEIWVNLSLTASTNTSIYVWYQSNAGTLQQPPNNYPFGSMSVWYPNFFTVLHGQTAASPADSTRNQFAITKTGTPTNVQGSLGNGVSFGSGNNYAGPNIDCGFSAGWVSWWLKPTNPYNQASEVDAFWAQCPNASPFTPAFTGQKYSDGNFYIGFQSGSTDYRLTTTANGFWTAGAWQRYDYVWNASGQKLYRNGSTQVGSSAVAPVAQSVTNPFNIALQDLGATKNYVVGAMDEFRMASFAPSANYLSTDYSIQSATNFVTVGTPQSTAQTGGAVYTGGVVFVPQAYW